MHRFSHSHADGNSFVKRSVLCGFVALVTVIMILSMLMMGQPRVSAQGGWTVVSKDVLSIDFKNSPPAFGAVLSPDGKSVALHSSGTLCIYAVTGDKKTCLESNDPQLAQGVDATSLQWSPDSKQLIFTENFFLFFLHPDVWIMDVESGKVRFLTGDGKPHALDIKKKPLDLALNLVPHWSKDGKTIFFLNCAAPCDPTTPSVVMQTIPSGAAPQQVATLTSSNSYVTLGYDVSSDGQHIAYIVSPFQSNDKSAGLWLYDVKAAAGKQLAELPDLADATFSADQQYVFAFNAKSDLRNFSKDEKPSGGRVVAVKDGNAVKVDSQREARYAGWSPTGSAMAYIVRDSANPDQSGLYIAEQPGTAGQLIYPSAKLDPANSLHGLNWTSDNSILLLDAGKLVVLHLGKK